MLPGVNAYSADAELLKTCDSSVIRREVRLEKGAAYGEIETSKTASPDDWPTYRGNTFRGGMTGSTIAGKLNIKWQAKLPSTPTASTVADGKVFVCDADTHALYALDSETGKTLWTFTTDGRIDSPPTYHKGMVLFGGAGRLALLPPSRRRAVGVAIQRPPRQVDRSVRSIGIGLADLGVCARVG